MSEDSYGAPRRGRLIAIIVAVLLIAAAAFYFYKKKNAEKPEETYRTQAVDRGDVVMSVTATGTLSAVTTVQVGSQVSGVIANLYANFNSPVKKGQLLAELDPTPFQAQVEQRSADLRRAQVERANASATYARQKRLVDSGLVSAAELENIRAALDSASAQVDQAAAALRQVQTNLKYTSIRSPIDGVVVERQYDIGQTVAASFSAPTLFTIAQDLTKMQVQADIDQADIGRLQVGQTARFTVDAYPEERFTGRISDIRLNATTNQNVVTYPVIVEVSNPEQKLRPKMTADVTIDVAEANDVLRVPNAALRFKPEEEEGGDKRPGAASGARGANGGAAAAGRQGGAAGGRGAGGMGGGRRGRDGEARSLTVYVLENGKPVPRQVVPGITDGRFTEVKGGTLKDGEKIIIGKATAKVDASGARPPGMGGPGMGGAGARGGRR
jgi:HlyD family secretion protein